MSANFTLFCPQCNYSFPKGRFAYLCPECESHQPADSPPVGVLKTLYPYDIIREKYSAEKLFSQLKKNHFLDILPIEKAESLGPLKVGQTPLYKFELDRPDDITIPFYLKDDSQNPTFSFKDRASQLVSAYAKEQDIDTIVTASTGNAGSSLAGICASQKQRAVIIVPKTAPPAKLLQIIMYGATLVMVDGNYDAAFDLSVEASRYFGWFNRNTAFNPLTIEGKKTVAFEIYDQLRGEMPSRIFVSVGDGVVISGLYKGFEDLMKLGIIKKIPLIVAVQSEKSDNLVRNLEQDKFQMKPSTTLADSISVDYPRNYFMARSFLKTYKGEWMLVSDKEIMLAASELACNTGIFAEPAAAAAMAGMLKYINTRNIDNNRPMLVMSTGSGLKDIKTPMQYISLPEPIKPGIKELSEYILKNHPE
ncbi:MAG: pyridoxal-phosphate dependent enzyme [Bacteroidetes bacterium]|nr:MAG: pyridoxal-phosphate dependent enzyme [Bacteroidota bacterium]